MISSAQLKAAVAAAKGQFGLLRKKYPIINGYLVLSLPSGQTGLDSSPAQILKEFPAVVVDDAAKTSALNLQSSLTDENTSSEVERRSKEKLDQVATLLNFDEKCQVEIRFNDLNYDLIWKLQLDELVDRNLTPQTKASIRIVLGTLAHFAVRA